MRIAQIATLSAPVSRETGGSVESLVWLLTRELVGMGHEVTVFGAAAGSQTDGEFVATLPAPYGQEGSPGDWQLCEWINLCRAVEQSNRFDLLHSHAYLWGLPLEMLSRSPMLHTMHIVPDDDAARLWSIWPTAQVTAISRQHWSSYPQFQPAAIIPHGLDLSQFHLRETPGDYICYLGRFTSGKGPRHAISIARKMGVHLLLAGPENPYFREQVKPLVDGKSVEYLGRVKGDERDHFLGGARALVYPIQYPEPFGLVLIEAMLCGTPVAAIRMGAVPEIVEQGVTGYMAESMEDLPAAVANCFALDRRQVRARAQERFSAERMAQAYAQLYQNVVEHAPATRKNRQP